MSFTHHMSSDSDVLHFYLHITIYVYCCVLHPFTLITMCIAFILYYYRSVCKYSIKCSTRSNFSRFVWFSKVYDKFARRHCAHFWMSKRKKYQFRPWLFLLLLLPPSLLLSNLFSHAPNTGAESKAIGLLGAQVVATVVGGTWREAGVIGAE